MTLRAHLATFPPRRALMLDVVARLSPQVDILQICLNGYDTVPRELAKFANVKPTIPPRDLMDAGKFLPTAWPDDPVLLVDDDIAYPPDYAARLLGMGEKLGLDHNAVGFQGLALTDKGPQPYVFRKKLGAVRGVGQLGTGTALILGRHLPTLAQMEPARGWVDVRFARHLADIGVRPWALPRDAGWLISLMTDALRPTTLFERVHKAQPQLWHAEQQATLARFPHMGKRPREMAEPPAPKTRRIIRQSD